MKKYFVLIILLLSSSFFATAQSDSKDTGSNEKNHLVEIRQIAENVFVHTSEQDVDGNLYSSNGLLVRTSDGFVLLDTPWNDEQTEFLLNKIGKEFSSKVIYAIITHSHDDRIGGIRTLIKNNITTVSSQMTVQFATKAGYPPPQGIGKTDTTIKIADFNFEVFYPGPGHTRDNITVYVRNANVLFAGCFLKTLATNSIGNIQDSDVNSWIQSINKLSAKYPHPSAIVPGHGSIGDSGIYAHTIKIVDTYLKSQKKK